MAEPINPAAAGVAGMAVSTRILARLVQKGLLSQEEGITILREAVDLIGGEDRTEQALVRDALQKVLPNANF